MVLRQFFYSPLFFGTISFALACCASPSVAETVLLDFTSPNCGPCRQMAPTVDRLAAAGHKVRAVDITREPRIAERFGVSQVPTFIVLVDGRETARSVGLTSFEQLQQMLAHVPPQRQRSPLGQSPDDVTTTFASVSQPTATANSPATPQAGRIVPIQDPPSAATRSRTAGATRNPFPAQPTGQATTPSGSTPSQRRLIESSVKVSVQDPDGKSAGAGTIVDARSGEALILTCGHLFRTSAGKGPITVTLYQAGPNGADVLLTTAGRLIDYDLERDLALVSMRPEAPVRPIPIAKPGTVLTAGAPVTTVGCNHGQNPTAIATEITFVDRYQGPPNVEVAGAPVEGRSGGGLFNAAGELVGVCFAADPEGNEGLYSSLPSIHAKLDSLGLEMVYNQAATDSLPLQQTATQPPVAKPESGFAVRGQEPAPPKPATDMPFAAAATLRTPPQPVSTLSTTEQAALEEIQRRSVDSEVICIIRPKQADRKSEVITLSNASPAFVNSLTSPVVSAVSQSNTPSSRKPNFR